MRGLRQFVHATAAWGIISPIVPATIPAPPIRLVTTPAARMPIPTVRAIPAPAVSAKNSFHRGLALIGLNRHHEILYLRAGGALGYVQHRARRARAVLLFILCLAVLLPLLLTSFLRVVLRLVLCFGTDVIVWRLLRALLGISSRPRARLAHLWCVLALAPDNLPNLTVRVDSSSRIANSSRGNMQSLECEQQEEELHACYHVIISERLITVEYKIGNGLELRARIASMYNTNAMRAIRGVRNHGQ